MDNLFCLGITKSGEPCHAKACSSGYCPMHDPARIAEREKERQAREEDVQASQDRCKCLREVVNVMKATCEGKGWRVSERHFDYKTGRHAVLEVERFTRLSSLESVTGVLDLTYSKGYGVQFSLQKTSFYSHGIQDLQEAIKIDLEHLIPWLVSPEKLSQHAVPGSLQKLEKLLLRFHRAAYQLTQRYDDRRPFLIDDEYDVQDLLHALLLTLFDDVRPEDPAPSLGGKSSRLDFLLKKEKIVVEAKMTRKTLRDGEIGEQLFTDIKRYQAHPDCQTLVCFVYDPDHYLKNPKALESDLSRKHDNLAVRVIIYSP